MERIFHYLAAVFTRFLFLIHAVLMICWLVLVKGNGFYFVFLVLLVALFIETIYTVVFRKGHEHNGFCLSMFLYLLAVIPCDWITKREVLKCIVETRAQNPGSVRQSCQKAVSTDIGQTLMSIFPNSDDEVVIYTLEQALVLILVIGRWLLPKGSLSRDQLSQLLLVYVGVAADIIEFTEIIKEDEIRNAKMLMNKHFVNAVILFWSVSLFQFTLTISVTERSAQRIEKEKAQLEEEIKKLKELERARKRNQIAPALYTYKRSAPQQKVEEIKLKYIHTRYGLEIEPDTQGSLEDDPEKGMDSTRDQRGYRTRFKEYLVAFGSKCQGYVELVILLIPLIMQDGPYLTIRLIAIAYYDVSHSTLYFLTVKNALVVMLQVYRIFVLYYKPPDDADDVSEFDHSARLTNVQTAIKGVQHARLAIRLVTRLQKQARWHKAGRTYNDIKKTDTPPGLQI